MPWYGNRWDNRKWWKVNGREYLAEYEEYEYQCGLDTREYGGDAKIQRDKERRLLASQRLERREWEGKASREQLTSLLDPTIGGVENPEEEQLEQREELNSLVDPNIGEVENREDKKRQVHVRVPLDSWSRFTRSLKPRMTVKDRLSVWRLEIWTDFTLRLI